MGVQHRLAAHFRRLADEAEDRTNLDEWAAFVEALPDDNEHVLAIARAQAEIGDPAQFTPRCDDGLHMRVMAAPARRGNVNQHRFAGRVVIPDEQLPDGALLV